jgi:hypothetical protein
MGGVAVSFLEQETKSFPEENEECSCSVNLKVT